MNLHFFFSSCVCASSLYSSSAPCWLCVQLVEAEKGRTFTHSTLSFINSSVVEVVPATVELGACFAAFWAPVGAAASSTCFLTSVAASCSCRFRTDWPHGGADIQETSSSAKAVHIVALERWIKCFYVDAANEACCVTLLLCYFL